MALDPVSITLAVIAVISAGASYVQAKKAQKKAKELTEGVEANIESNSKEIPVVYGKRRVGGVRVYIDTSRDKKHQYLYMVLAMAEGEVESITDIKIDDVSIEDDRFNYDGLLSERNLEFEVFLGSDGQEASTLIGNGVSYDYDRLGEIYNDPFADQHERDAADPNRVLPWSSKHKLSGIAYLALKFKWDEGAYTGIPDVTAVVKGRKVYDPRTSTTAWSDNPALCIRDYLTNERFGKGLPASAIDDVAFSQAANDLDSFIAYPYQDSPEYQYLFRMNHVVDTSKKIMENLNDMIIACRGFIPYSKGVYSLKIDQTSSSVLDIGPDQIISGIAVAGARKEDRFNQVKVNFFNASSNYKEDQAIYPEQNSTLYQQYLAEDEGEPLVDEIDLYSINNYYSAREMARLFLERSRQNMTIAFQGTSELINLEVGEVVSITHPTPAWTNKLFQVQEVALAFDGTVQITCIEYDAALYTYDTPAEEQPYVGTRLPDPNQVEPPTNLTTTTGTYIEADGKTTGYIDISWSAPEDSLVDRYELKFEYSSREEVIELASTEYRVKPTQDNVSYVISVRAVNGLGIRSAWLTAAAVTSVIDTTAPSDITGINISAGLQSITLDWTNPSEDDFDLVRIKHNTVDEEPSSHSFEVRSDSFVHDIGAYSTTKHYWLAPVDRTGNVGNYVSGGFATTGSIDYSDVGNTPTIPVIPEIATTVYLTLSDSNAPTDAEFNAAVGRDPIENDFVVVNKEFAFNYKYNTETEVYEWQSVTEFIDGSLLVSGSLSASDITTGTLNANDVTISNLTIGGSQLPNNIAYIRDTKNISVIINEDVSGSNVGEAVLVGFTDGVADKSVNGFITYKGAKYTINVTQGSTDGVTILTASSNKNGYIVYDSTESNKFTTPSYGNRNVAFVWYDGTNWRYDPNTESGTIFTPTDTDLALGTMSTGSSDFITSADLFFEVVKLTEAQEKGTTINYGYLDFATTDEVSGIVSTYTNDQGFISSVNWTEVVDAPTSLSELNSDDGDKLSNIEDNATAGADWNSNVANIPSDIVFDGDITDVVREEQVYANLLIDSDETQQTIPYPVTEASAIEYTINSSVARSEALIVIDALDAEGVTIPNGVQWSLNGVYQSQLNGPDNARVEYKFVVPLIAGDNSIKVWSAGQDGGTVYSVKAYTYESGGGQWFRLSGRANTNAPSNEDFKTAFGRYPAPRDVILIQATSGATASYYFNKTLNAWDNAEAIVHGDLIVSESITALGEVTAGTFSLGNGAFTVNSSGQLSATGAVIDGNITAESLDVEDATVTGTLSVPIDWAGSNIGAIGASNLGESVTNLIDERVSSYTLSSAGDYKEDDAEFSASSIAYPLVIGFNHVNGTNVELSLVGSKTWTANFASPALVPDDNTLTIKLQRRTNPDGVWETIKTVNAGETGINGGDYALSYGTVYYNGIYINITHLDDPATDIYDYRAFIDNVGDNYSATVPLKLEVNEAGFTAGLSVTTGTASGGGSLSYDDNGTFTFKPADLSSYATESYVDTAVSNLVDTAPTTLNTLNELAAALGDDPNFATTTATSLGNKANKAGDTFTGDVTFNTKVKLPQNPVGTTYGNSISTTPTSMITQAVGDNDGWRMYGEAGASNDVKHIFEIVDDIETGDTWVFRNKKTYSPYTATEPFKIQGNGNIIATGTITASGYNKTNWDTAYGWGNHASAGYLATTLSTLDSRYGLVADSAHSVYKHSNSGTGATWTSFDFPAYNNVIGRDYYVFDVYGYEDFTKAGKFVHYTVYVNIKNGFGQPPSGNEITVQVVANLEADQNQANAGNFEFKLERDLVDGNGIPHHKLWIEADERYSALHIVAVPVYIGDFTRTLSNMFATQSTEPTTTITYPVINSASVEAPLPPSVTSTTIVGETIEIVFSESSTSDTDRYEVWSDNGGSSYSLIGVIPLTDIASSMSFIDSTFTGSGTISYRVYAVKMGAYSTPATTTKDFTLPTLDVANLQVIPDINVFSVSYDIPDSRFVDHIEIYLDTDTLSSGTSRANASLVYSGNRGSYTHNINSANRDDYHQFWVEVVEG